MGNIDVFQNALGYWEVTNKPNEIELEEYYSKIYFQTNQGAYAAQYSPEELEYFDNGNEMKFRIVEDLLKVNAQSEKRLLDIGCGEGFTLDFFRKRHWQTLGLDYSVEGVKKKNPQVASNVIQGNIYHSIDSLISQKKTFEVITVLNVLEHVIDPIKLLKDLNHLLVPGGILIILVPNDFSQLQLKLLNEKKISSKFWVRYPDHLNYFSRESLINVCESTGFEFRKCISDFPIDYFLANPDSNYIESKDKGKNCHFARIWLENMQCSISIEKTIQLYEAFANLGSGRQISGYFVKP